MADERRAHPGTYKIYPITGHLPVISDADLASHATSKKCLEIFSSTVVKYRRVPGESDAMDANAIVASIRSAYEKFYPPSEPESGAEVQWRINVAFICGAICTPFLTDDDLGNFRREFGLDSAPTTTSSDEEDSKLRRLFARIRTSTGDNILKMLIDQKFSVKPEFLPRKQEKSELNEAATRLLETSFSSSSGQYVDDGLLDMLQTTLSDICSKWKRSEYLAPYTVIFQSSGFGKSRLVCEYGRQRSLVFYVNIRELSESGAIVGYPHPSFVADQLTPAVDVLRNVKNLGLTGLTAYYICFIAACLKHANVQIEQGQFHIGNNEKRRAFIESQLYADTSTPSPLIGVDFWKSVIEYHQQFFDVVLSNPQDGLLRAIWFLEMQIMNLRDNLLKQNDKAPPVLFAFDECRTLLTKVHGADQNKTYFHFLRSAMHHVNEKSNICFVLLDTFGALSEISPSENDIIDPSLRYIFGRKLFAPFYSFAFQKTSFEDPDSPDGFAHNLKSNGRYLWKSLGGNIPVLNDLAETKLLSLENPRMQRKSTTDYKDEHFFAVTSPRLGLFAHSSENIFLNLVKSHCATLSYCSHDRRVLFTSYPPEPAIIEAATSIMRFNTDFSWEIVLKRLIYFCRIGLVEGGARGELLGRILLLMAMDAAREKIAPKRDFSTIPLTLPQFFEQFGGKELYDKVMENQPENNRRRIKGTTVNFSAFMYITYSLTKAHQAEEFYKRNLAVFCRRNEEAIDLLIPMRYKNDVSKISSYSFMLIQCKDYDYKSSGDGTKSLVPAKIDEQMASLALQNKPTTSTPPDISKPPSGNNSSDNQEEPVVVVRRSPRFQKSDMETCIFLLLQVGFNQKPGLRDVAITHATGPTGSPPDQQWLKKLGLFGIDPRYFTFIRNDDVLNRLLLLSRTWTDPLALLDTDPDLGKPAKESIRRVLLRTNDLAYEAPP